MYAHDRLASLPVAKIILCPKGTICVPSGQHTGQRRYQTYFLSQTRIQCSLLIITHSCPPCPHPSSVAFFQRRDEIRADYTVSHLSRGNRAIVICHLQDTEQKRTELAFWHS